MQLNKELTDYIFACADKQREIEKYIQDLLYTHAVEKKCYCTWVIEYPQYDKEVGFEFKIKVTSENKQHTVTKRFCVPYEWANEKIMMQEIVLNLLDELVRQANGD